jgi:hypothetical protein
VALSAAAVNHPLAGNVDQAAYRSYIDQVIIEEFE